MFKDENQAHGTLGEVYDPLALLWDSLACILAANEKVDWASVGFEVFVDYPVALFPV
jgi:hypothetical protein